MAEFLLSMNDGTRGDILHVAEDGSSWGRMEHLSPDDGTSFLVVRVPITLEEAQQYLVPVYGDDVITPSGDVEKAIINQCRYYVDVDTAIGISVLDAVRASNWDVVTISADAIKDKEA